MREPTVEAHLRRHNQEILDKVSYVLDIPLVYTQLDSKFKKVDKGEIIISKDFLGVSTALYVDNCMFDLWVSGTSIIAKFTVSVNNSFKPNFIWEKPRRYAIATNGHRKFIPAKSC